MKLHTVSRLRLLALLIGIALPAIAHAVDVPIRGSSGVAKIDARSGTPKLAKLKSSALKNASYPIPNAGDPNDPRIAGGTYRKCKFPGGVGRCETIELPASKWVGLGNPPGVKGWRYVGFGSPTDPCRSIHVLRNKIRVTCRGPNSLDPSFTLPIGIESVVDELTLGDLRYCTKFDRPFRKDSAKKGKWQGKGARAPSTCPDLDAVPTPTPTPTPTPSPTPSPTPQPTPTAPPPYGSASSAFLLGSESLFE